jgi:uncharacterized paraquat-inducible protein A
MKKHTPIALFILSIVCLIPGVTLPLMSIKATINKQEMLELAMHSLLPPSNQSSGFMKNMLQSFVQKLNVEGSAEVFESTRSLLGTMSELITHDHAMVGLLVGLFGLVIPVIKIILTLVAIISQSQHIKRHLFKINSLLSKWSMSDVYVMAIIVAFLTINANEQAIGAVQLNAQLHSGFYFFAAYCLLAIAASQLLEKNTC